MVAYTLRGKPDYTEVGGSKVDGILFQLYDSPCEHPEPKDGEYNRHLTLEITDERDPHRPVLINQLIIIDEDLGQKAHFRKEDEAEVLAKLGRSIQDLRFANSSYDEFIRNVYAAPTINSMYGIPNVYVAGVPEPHPASAGSKDDEGPDLFGGFDLNTLLR